ncbi:hypothetical protein SNE35_04205 [Paucibacter sp. R3-3]|uniref:Uncharacterized protein n=1 Tax=Roseateles agri TaxID=3098619 RepID=A0ABU5DBN5_9BURK|nr:hypothetical protein [Paucibacter sp. R3-3]
MDKPAADHVGVNAASIELQSAASDDLLSAQARPLCHLYGLAARGG